MLRTTLAILLVASLAGAGEGKDPVAALTELVDSPTPEERTAEELSGILGALRKTEGKPLPGDTVSSILSIATEYLDLDDEPHRMAELRTPSLAVLRALFHPRWHGTAEGPGFRVEGLGFWPEPTRVTDYFQFLVPARKTPDPVKARPPLGPFRDYVRENDPATGVAVTARRAGKWLRISIVSRRTAPLHVNPLAFRIGAARLITPDEGEPEIRLTLGAPSSNFRLELPPDEELYPTIEPGCAKTFTYPLVAGLADSPKLFVEFIDGFVLLTEKDRKLPHPRLVSFRAVPVDASEAPLGDDDRKARALVDELVARDSSRDRTGPVNALLALGPNVVARALGDALDRACVRDSPADRARTRIYALAHLVGGLPPLDEDREWVIDRYPVHSGFVLGCEASGGRYYREHHRRWGLPIGIDDLLGPEPKLVKPFAPDAADLLRRLLETDELVDHRKTAYGTRYAAGLAVGEAARNDPAMAERILSGFTEREFEDRDEDAEMRRLRALTAAVGALGTEAAREALGKRIDALIDLPRGPGLWAGLTEVAAAMRRAGDSAGIREARRRLDAPGVPAIHRRWFERGLGPDLAVEPFLRRAERAPGGPAIIQLAQRLEEIDAAEWSPDTVRRVLDLAYRSEKPGGLQATMVRNALWPGTSHATRSSTEFRHVAPGEVEQIEGRIESGHVIAGWPDPLVSGRLFRTAIANGSLRLGGTGPSVYSEFRPPTAVPAVSAWRAKGAIRVEIRNGGRTPVAINPLAFQFAVAEDLEVTAVRGRFRLSGQRLIRIHLGRLGGRPRIAASRLSVVPPGERRSFYCAIPADLPGQVRIAVTLDDIFETDGESPAPRIRRIPLVEAR